VDVAEDTLRLAELAQHLDVVVGQVGAAGVSDGRPRAVLGDGDAALVSHLEEQQVGDLLDVVAVVDAVVAQRVAEAPESLNDVGHAAMALLRSRIRRSSHSAAKARLTTGRPPMSEKIGMLSKSSRSIERFCRMCSRMRS